MKRRIAFSIIIMLGMAPGLHAQASLDTLLNRVNKGNTDLIAASTLLQSQVLDARTGLTPDNPEVEIAYLWGTPEALGTRTDFTVSQSFDFPTVYTSKSKLSKINQVQAELQYAATRQEILLKAQQAWITRVYLNIRESMLSRRLDFAIKVFAGFERKLATGEVNQLQVNQARMKVIALENEFNLLQREFVKNNTELLNLSGNDVMPIADTIFPASAIMILDSLLSAYRMNYLNQLFQSEVDRKAKEVDVVFNQKLPKLKAGYYSEKILNARLQGIQAGITIPLWGDARAVKTAKANLVFAESDADRFWQHEQNEIRQRYEEWNYLRERELELERLLAISNDESLLRQAMIAGEISLTQYYYESDFYFQNLMNMLEFKKELLLLEADLRKVYY